MSPTYDVRPGLFVDRLSRLVHAAVDRCALDLTGASVLTEAATGPYVVTPVIAALAGAHVVALTADSRYARVAEVCEMTAALADAVGVSDRLTVTTNRSPAVFADADVVTNSGHLRPIVGEFAAAIKPTAVIPLMFEAWEIQAGRVDIDIDGLRARGIRLAGTNERHPHIDVFSFLGPMAVAELADAGVSAHLGRIAVLCDNPFADYLASGLKGAGADVRIAAEIGELFIGPAPDALLVACRPTGASVLSTNDVTRIATDWPATPVVQFWGDLDRQALDQRRVPYWPTHSPGPGHMGVLPSRTGPEPVVRLQAGGLKVAQVLRTPAAGRTDADLAYIDAI